MSDATYKASHCGEVFEISGDFDQASSPVYGVEGGRQVADFRHSPAAAMRAAIEECVTAGGDDPDSEEISAEIDEAVDGMLEVGSEEDAEVDGYSRIGDSDCYVRVEKYSDGDSVTWRIGSEILDDACVFGRLTSDLGMTAQEAVEAMAADGPRGEDVAKNVLELVLAGKYSEGIYRHDGSLVIVGVAKIEKWDCDEDEAVGYAVESWDCDEDTVRESLAD